MTHFEIKDKDLAARIGKLTTKHGEIETPSILPVINPSKRTLTTKEIQETGAQALITNAYLLKKNHLHEVLTQGLHEFLDFPGPIMTDSGAYQLMEYGEIALTNKEVLKFQEKINTDIGVILDTPTSSEKKEDVEKAVSETIKKVKESETHVKDKETLYVGPLQGWNYPEQFKKCLKTVRDLDYDIHAIGSVVPLMKRYGYPELFEPMSLAKKHLPEDRPIHLFGAGHPLILPFAVAMGMDIFDSAAYSLYAQDERYMTPTGTKKLKDLQYLPCNCPVCANNSPEELKKNTKKLAKHNLYVTFREMKRIKQAIKERTLFELLETKSRAHPSLKKLMDKISNDMETMKKRDPITKKHLFKVSKYSEKRPDYKRAIKKTQEIQGKKIKTTEFGEVPEKILECYPFSHTGEENPENNSTDLEKVKGASEYWLGEDIIPENVKIKKSPRTGKIREVHKDKELFIVLRSRDFMTLLHEAAKELHKKTKYPYHRIVMDEEAEKFVKEGGSVFNKFVKELDPNLKAGEPVIMVNQSDELLAAGETYLTSDEIKDFNKGEAAKNRWHIKK